ncbi:MAG: ankyrin repeat domain-containing protein [Candidatus Dependentiae bacterium]
MKKYFIASLLPIFSLYSVDGPVRKKRAPAYERKQQKRVRDQQEQQRKNQLALMKYTHTDINKNMPLIRGLFEFGNNTDPNIGMLNEKQRKEFGGSPLHNAARAGNLEVVQLLLGKGAIVIQALPTKRNKKNNNYEYNTPLHEAVRGHQKDGDYLAVIKALRDAGANVNCGGVRNKYIPLTPLMVCVLQIKPSMEVLEELLSFESIDLNRQSKDKGQTALHIAVVKDYTKIIHRLIDEGADSTVQDKFHRTAKDLIEKRKLDIQNKTSKKRDKDRKKRGKKV